MPTPPRLRPARLLLLALASLAAGCTPSELSSGPKDPMAPASKYGTVVRLTVQNNDFKDATVYVTWEGGARRRVGMVTGKSSATFTFDWVAHKAWFEADFVAGGNFKADPIEVWEGDHLDLVIMNQG